MSGYLTREQVEQVLRPINTQRVSQRAGMAYVEAYDVRAHMARIFGVCRWSSEVVEQVLICDDQIVMGNNKPGWYVAYRSIVKLTVCAPDGTQLAVYSEGHAGDSTHPVRGEAHGNAITNSESYAFKRAACMALLDQGGLSLYGKGSTAALVKGTLVMPEGTALQEAIDHDLASVHPEGEPKDDHAETSPISTVGVSSSAAPVDDPPVAPPSTISPAVDVEALREQVKNAMKLPKRDALIALGSIKAKAISVHALGLMTSMPNGDEVTVNVLIDEMLKVASARKS